MPIPVFNKERALERGLAAVEAQSNIVSEIVIVDDASSDATANILAGRPFAIPTTVVRHERNKGKGAAIRTGLAHATANALLIQDVDREYSPEDYGRLLEPLVRDGAEVV